ncbi:MAG: radical SAM protein [Deltaproteobacteria bacterium]|nr:MAG: radical SAM protein [Deltaproteobacteria bacterium]
MKGHKFYAGHDGTKFAYGGCPPLEKLHIYLTSRCNEQCQHCWVEAGPEQTARLAAPEVNRQINLAMPLGLQSLKITGGEPLLYKGETLSILSHAAGAGIVSKLETNGVLITNTMAAELAKLGCVVSISIDGASSESHDAFRRTKGSFDRRLHSVEKLISEGCIVEAVSCIHRGNVHQVHKIVSLCNCLGISYLKFNFPSRYGRAIRLADSGMLLSTAEILGTIRRLEQRYPLGNTSMELDFDIPRALRMYPRDGLRCKVMNLISILPDGRYSLCGIGVTHKDITFGTIKQQDIDEVWRESEVLTGLRNAISDGRKGVCGICTQYDACLGHCAAYMISEFGSINAQHPLCQDAYDRGLFPENFLKVL